MSDISGLGLDGRLTTEENSPTQAAPLPLHRISDQEAKLYYAGVRTRPVLIARTSNTPWEELTGPEAYPRPKEVRPVPMGRAIIEVWDGGLDQKVQDTLRAKQVDWTRTGIVCFGYEDEPSGNAVVWIGVKPGSLSYEAGIEVAFQCKELLLDHGLNDVDVEIYEGRDEEAAYYYAGLPSHPVLVVRTGRIPWTAPTGWYWSPRCKELRVVGNHAITEVWEDNLALKVHAILHAKQVDWTSTDVVRIGHVDETPKDSPVVLWIGVKFGSLSHGVAIEVARHCKDLLLEYDIDDVEVEIRESQVFRSAGPQLLPHARYGSSPRVDAREPFTAALGIPICVGSTPWAEGTGGFFLEEGGDSNRLLLVTARHVVFPQSDSNLLERKPESQPRHDVLLLSERAFQKHLTSIEERTKWLPFDADLQTRRIEAVAERKDASALAERERAQRRLREVEATVKELTAFHQELSTYWASDSDRNLGHAVFAPPIAVGAGPEQYTQDVAVIEIDASKIDSSSFQGNVIDLGGDFRFATNRSAQPSKDALYEKMHLNARNSRNFRFPADGLLRLSGTIPDDEMRKPTSYDYTNVPCTMVIKRGGGSGLTVGRANNVFSYVRRSFGSNETNVSKEWPIVSHDEKSGAFSALGDSGSVVVDGAGRMGGFLTSGAGTKDSFDLSYVTPISFVLKTIRSSKSLAQAYPKEGLSV